MAPKRKSFWTNNKKDLKRKKIESTQCLTSCPIESYNSKVRLFESRSLLRKVTCTKAKISRYHILEMENTNQNIYHQIISTDINLNKCDENINFDNIIPTVLPILEKFKEQHNRFKYFDELKNILGNVNKSAKPKYKNQVHVKLLKTFFGFLLYKNVPLELFGTWKNFKAVKKTIYCLLKTHPKKMPIKPSFRRNKNKSASMTTEGLLDIEPLLRKFDISKVMWLDPLQTAKEKWIIVLKLLHWFFAQYIIKILHKNIVVMSIRQQWVYIRKDYWCQMQHAFINEKVKNGDLILDQQMLKEQDIFKCIEKHRLILSSSGLRLLAVRKAEKKSLEISTILTILQQLYSTFFNNGKGLPTIKNCIQQVNKFKNLNKNHLYYVRCDIQDAFGSIIQEKLFDIIRIYFKELPIYLRMRDCKKKSKKKHMFEETRQCLDMKQLRNIYIIKSRKPRLLNWLKLISWIKKLLLEQNIILYGKKYSIKTGVLQGLRMSPIFSDIYYQHMSEQLFHKFKSKGVLCRYVDDILYITEEKSYAEEFLKIVRNGIPEYNVKFNLNKIKTNVELPFYKSTKIKYLGKSLFI